MMSMRSIHIDVTFEKASVTGAFLLDREVHFSYSLSKRKRWKAVISIISSVSAVCFRSFLFHSFYNFISYLALLSCIILILR